MHFESMVSDAGDLGPLPVDGCEAIQRRKNIIILGNIKLACRTSFHHNIIVFVLL
jgi:hypothetical protein